jgi:hypothetical protein
MVKLLRPAAPGIHFIEELAAGAYPDPGEILSAQPGRAGPL